MKRLHRIVGRLLLAALAAIFIWQLVAEIVEPHFALHFYPRSPSFETPSISDTALRLYGDTRPHVGKIAGLQKGLVWIRNGQALVEEGYGFGCPIVEFDNRAYISREAEIERSTEDNVVRLIKHYHIDTLDTPIQFLRRKYRPVPSLGTVTIGYDIHPNGTIDVTVDFSRLSVSWSRAYLMNEQGARRFTRYLDVEGTRLEADQIGIWTSPGTFIARACFDSADGTLGFCVEPEAPAFVYYGRERYNQYNWRGIFYLSWAGIDIELAAPQPIYRYRITLEER